MPRQTPESALKDQLLAVAQRMAQEVAEVVRQYYAAEVRRLMANGGKRGAGALAKQRGGRRGAAAGAAEAVLQLIKSKPGLRTEKMYEALPLSKQAIKAGLAKLREQKRVKVRGERRAATYYPA
jgi:hypothetical protein